MAPSNLQDAQLSQLSDDYIRNLEPENQRYDITLAQDFVISVLPNGIKTWAFIYDFQGRHRRKTLGVFPEMNFEDARQALEKARASMQRMDEPTVAPNEFGQLPAVLGGGKYIPKEEREPFNWKRLFMILGILAALAAIGAVGTLVFQKWNPFAGQSDAAQTTTETTRQALPFTLDKEITSPAETPASSRPTSGLPFDVKSEPADASASNPATTQSGVSSQPVVPRTQQPSRPATTSTPPAAQVSSSPSETAAATRVQPAAPGNAPRPAASKPVTTLASTTKATAFGGRVSRSRLTSRVQELEPTDTLGPEISYKNSGFTRVFYFTELREFSDGTVVHRWLLNDEVKEEVVLKVRKSWRWRTYSNKDLTPGLNGQWRVETIDATGKVPDTEEFTYDYQ